MPPIGVLLGGVDFSDRYLQLTNREQTHPSLHAAGAGPRLRAGCAIDRGGRRRQDAGARAGGNWWS